MFSSCVSMIPDVKLEAWAYDNGFILETDCPESDCPERQPLPHPEIPTIQIRDADGNLIPITEEYLMKTIITLFGSIEKYQYLTEIYEREYLNADGKIMPDLTLEELKALYLERVGAIEEVVQPENDPLTGFPSTGSVEREITVAEFAVIVEAFNYFQQTGTE